MKKAIKYIFSFLDKQTFIPSVFSILINPLFIIRYALFKTLKKSFNEISGNVLDFGCGSSPYKSLIKFEKYVGVDFANENHPVGNSVIDIFYDGSILPLEAESFDSIICTEVFEHIPNLDKILKELHRVLKHEGKILLSVPFVWNEHEIPNDYQRFSRFGIRLLLENNGFKILTVQKTSRTIHTITQLWTNAIHLAFFTRFFMLNYLINFIIVFPFNLVGWILGWIIPDKKKRLPLNIVILAEKL
ncbi:MAG: hypothetical protein Fur0028_01290 [Bacteroidales bacterium]